MGEHKEMEEHRDMGEYREMGEHAATEEVAGMEELVAGVEELAQIVEGTGQVDVACLLPEYAGGGTPPPRCFQAPQMSKLDVHVAQEQPAVCPLQGEAPWPGAAVWGAQFLAAACPCPSSCPSLAAYKRNIHHFIHVSLSP